MLGNNDVMSKSDLWFLWVIIGALAVSSIIGFFTIFGWVFTRVAH